MRSLILIVLLSVLNGQTLDEQYHTVEEIYQFLDTLDQSEIAGDWVHLDTIGYSTQDNIPILAVRISDNAHIKEDEPRVLFVGQVHAEEILGIEIVIDMIKDLLFPSASIQSHMNILKQYLDIWFIPTANPEGLNIVHQELDLSFRKNKRDLSPLGPIPNGVFDYDPSIGNDIDGVDLNRNFEFNWVFGDTFLEPDNSDYASHYDYYKGEEPFSESESIAIRDLALENDFVFSIVWHSSRSGNLSEKVFTSWKWEEVKESPDLGIMKSIADHFANGIETEDGTSTYLSVFSGSRNGKLHDWFYRETGCIQYLVECGTSNLQPDSILIDDTIDRTKPAMVYLMDRAIGYYTDAAQITGIVYDGSTGAPIQGAIVEVEEHSGSVLKPRKTNEFGRYRRILDVGTYSFVFHSEGYISKNISLVANNSAITEEHIYLEPAPSYRLNLDVIQENSDNVVLNGKIINRYGEESISITSGTNEFNLFEGHYTIEFQMENEFMPWGRTIYLNSDMDINIPYAEGYHYDLRNWPWENSEGEWCVTDSTLRSQEFFLYANGDSTTSDNFMETELFDVAGANRVAVKIEHRFETEWDLDLIKLSIRDRNDVIIGNRTWSGDSWDAFSTDIITAVSDTSLDQVKVRISFAPDQTVNYRGWVISSVSLAAISDQYLDITEKNKSNIPRIPMRISNVHPNPSFGKLQVNIDGFPGGNAILNIYNLLGQNVYTRDFKDISKGRQFIDLDLRNINGRVTSSGMFFVRIATKNQQAVKKCIIINQ